MSWSPHACPPLTERHAHRNRKCIQRPARPPAHPPWPHLVVVALDADKHLAQRVRAHHVRLPLQGQAPRGLHRLGRDVKALLRRQGGKQVHHGQGVIQVTQRVREGWVPKAVFSFSNLFLIGINQIMPEKGGNPLMIGMFKTLGWLTDAI